jgi:hypothetical protein
MPMPPGEPMPIDRADSSGLPEGGADVDNHVPVRTTGAIALILAVGIVAGLAAWLAGEASLDAIKPARRPHNARGITLEVVHPRDRDIADARNAALAFALLGAILGMGLGAAGGLARRSGRSAILAAISGLALGAISTAAISMALLPAYNTYRYSHPDEVSNNLIFPLLLHAAVWSVVGASAGAAFAAGRGERGLWPRAVQGGLVGAVVAAAVYELIGVVAFPAAGTTLFVSTTWPTRLLARLAVGTLTAVGIALAVAPSGGRPVAPTP